MLHFSYFIGLNVHCAAGESDQAQGPACKVFATEAFIADAVDLLDLTAPGSLVRGKTGLA